MNDSEELGLQLWSDMAAFHKDWNLVLVFKWRMVSRNQGGIGLAWPVGLEGTPSHRTGYFHDLCYGLA